jgi:hypothetical protein
LDEVLVTLTTWMLKVPEASGMQPSGAEVGGEICSVTPWGKGLANAVLAKARMADVYFMFVQVNMPSEGKQTVERGNRAASNCLEVPVPVTLELEEAETVSSGQWNI